MSTAIATLNIPKNPAQRRVWICGELRLRGTSLRRLAQKEKVSHQAMSAALVTSSSHLQAVIAAALGLTPQQLFPEYFDRSGNRLNLTREPQRNTGRPGRNVESGEAA